MTCWYLGGGVAVPQGPDVAAAVDDAAAAGDEAMVPAGAPHAASNVTAMRRSLIRTSTSW
jgi:hypothetical protein